VCERERGLGCVGAHSHAVVVVVVMEDDRKLVALAGAAWSPYTRGVAVQRGARDEQGNKREVDAAGDARRMAQDWLSLILVPS
jgi:hypothetical protein